MWVVDVVDPAFYVRRKSAENLHPLTSATVGLERRVVGRHSEHTHAAPRPTADPPLCRELAPQGIILETGVNKGQIHSYRTILILKTASHPVRVRLVRTKPRSPEEPPADRRSGLPHYYIV